MATDTKPKKSFARRYWWALCPLAVVLLGAVPFIRPIQFNFGDRSVSVRVQGLAPNGPFAADGVLIRRVWDGPTGSFSGGGMFGVKLGRKLLRLDITVDPIAAAQRRMPKSLDGLIQTLDTKDRWLKFCVLQELARMGASAKAALPALLRMVELGDEQAFDPLLVVSKAVGAEAVLVLTNALATASGGAREKAAEILSEMGPDAKGAIPTLDSRLHDSEPGVVLRSAFALWKIDGQTHNAIPVLARLLLHSDAEIRVGAAATLGELGAASAEAVPALLRALDDGSPRVRAISARALGRIGPAARPAIPKLILLLDDNSSEVPMWAANALGQFGEDAKAAVPRLTTLAASEDDEDDSARLAIEALGEIGASAAPALVKLYRDAERRKRHFITRALMKLGINVSDVVPRAGSGLGQREHR